MAPIDPAHLARVPSGPKTYVPSTAEHVSGHSLHAALHFPPIRSRAHALGSLKLRWRQSESLLRAERRLCPRAIHPSRIFGPSTAQMPLQPFLAAAHAPHRQRQPYAVHAPRPYHVAAAEELVVWQVLPRAI
eukprot:scaffold4930_cov26-Tisochrysis_lutea.AAC.1